MHRRAATAGFTLIELMITIAIVAILAAVAVASYDFAMVKARRGAAQGCLGEMAQFMERFHTTNMAYNKDTSNNDVVLPKCSTDVTKYYKVDFAAVPDATSYTLQAEPLGNQASSEKSCGTMTINEVGTKTPASGCW